MAVWSWSKSKTWQPVPLQGSCTGLRAVIVCNGPSLNELEVSRLAGPGRVVIAINSAYPKVRPDFWIGSDDPGCHHPGLWAEAFPKIMRDYFREWQDGKLKEMNQVWFADVSEEPDEEAWHWQNDTFRLSLQLAQWLGCTQFVFAGINMDVAGGDYADGNRLTLAQRQHNQHLYDQQFEWLREFTQVANCRTLCATRLKDIMPVIDLAALDAECLAPVAAAPAPRAHVTTGSAECNEYKALMERGGRDYSTGHQKMYLSMIEVITGNGACSVLDVGCGIGWGVGKLIESGHEGPIIAVEPEMDCIRHVVEKFQDTKADLTFIASSWLTADEGVVPCDFVFCIEVVEHLRPDQVEPFLAKLRKHTIKNLFLSTPDAERYEHGAAAALEWVERLEAAGFYVVRIEQQWTTLFICEPKS